MQEIKFNENKEKFHLISSSVRKDLNLFNDWLNS